MISPRAKTIVIDDEPLARRALRGMISDVAWLEWAGEAGDSTEAASLIERTRPELLFLDVQLPGVSGIDMLTKADVPLVVIFTTAFEQYALAAFELGAIDYLKKPFGRERFNRAIERAAPQVELLRVRGASATMLESRIHYAREARRPITEMFVRDRGVIIRVPVADVVRFEADGDYVSVFVGGRRHLVYLNLSDLADGLDPRCFIRVHRSHIVNLAHINALEPVDPNRVAVRLRDGTRVQASRSGTRLLRKRMRMDT